MAHRHDHDHASFYTEQLCTILSCAAIGFIAIRLYQRPQILKTLLAPGFYPFLLLGGFVLVGLTLVRALALWVNARRSGSLPSPDDHSCADEEHDGSDCAGEHSAHPGTQEHHHHSWAPWRFIVLLLPIVLYSLDLPDENFEKPLPGTIRTTEQHIKGFIGDHTSIFYEALPFIVLGALISGVLEELVPQRFIARFIPRNRLLSILLGGFLGLIFPMCECGIIPIMRRLLRKGLPLSTCTAYLLAGPIINIVVISSTLVAFSASSDASRGNSPETSAWLLGVVRGGWKMTALRVGLGYLVAVLTSMLVEWQWRRHGNSLLMPLAVPPSPEKTTEGEDNGPNSWQDRLGRVSQTALHDFVDITVFLILGALLASLSHQWLGPEQMAQISVQLPILIIPIMMGLAVLLCLCSEADAFVAASFTTLPSAAKLAFLVLGPMMDLKLYLLYTRVFRPRLIWTIIGAVVFQVLLFSTITHYLWNYFDPQGANPPPISGDVSASVEMEKERKAVADKGFDFSVGFQQLQQASATPESRQYYEGKTVQLVGRYLPGANDTTFGLVRYKMNCCAADAIPLSALIMLDPRSSQKLPPDLPGQWVQVRGQVQFWQRRDKPGVFATVVLVQPTPEHSLDDQVKRVRRPDNIYLY